MRQHSKWGKSVASASIDVNLRSVEMNRMDRAPIMSPGISSGIFIVPAGEDRVNGNLAVRDQGISGMIAL
jgi:hypothetical protein